MGLSISHLLVVLIVVFVVFGAGKLPKVMGDFGKGIRNFRDGLKGDDENNNDEKYLSHSKESKKE
jgi:sec-independent protein translocase protein TatA